MSEFLPSSAKRGAFGVVKRLLLDVSGQADEVRETRWDEPPRLTPRALEKTRMSRTRERILANLDDMYREAFERAKTTGDASQMTTLDFAYRREQLYFEVLLDIREAMERR